MEQAVGTRIAALRKRMAERGMDAYLIPTADFHGSEYVDGYFKARQFITGFHRLCRNSRYYNGGSRSVDRRPLLRAGG